MIHSLKTQNIGPIDQMDIQFGDRLNIITGDNGLGKSFILDLVWWALTRRWPYDVNKALTQGYMPRPHKKAQGKIAFSLTSDSGKPLEYASSFDYDAQAWTGKQGRPCNPGLVLYAMADGSFAVWDSARNYWKKKGNKQISYRIHSNNNGILIGKNGKVLSSIQIYLKQSISSQTGMYSI